MFLCIDAKYKNYLLLKRLKRAIIDFNNIQYFQCVGTQKTKLPETFGYYDEEDPDDKSRSRSARSRGLRSRHSKTSKLSKKFKTSEKEEGLKFMNIQNEKGNEQSNLQPDVQDQLDQPLNSVMAE
jgi:hypothetical protein